MISEQKWICCEGCDSPLIKKSVMLTTVVDASIDICVLGFFELYINGRKVSEDLLTPVCSQYKTTPGDDLLYPLNDVFADARIYYNSYDIKDYLAEGENTFEFYLGNGWYNQKDRTIEGKFAFGDPKMCFEVNFCDADGNRGKIVSDETLLWKRSYIKYNNIFYGERHDYRADENKDEFKNVSLCEAIDVKMCLQECPSDKVIRKIVPKLLKNHGRKRVYDCGENITGWVSFKSNKATRDVVITFAEEINSDCTLDYDSTGYESKMLQMQKDEFVLDGIERYCRPKFTWHGFRYFEFEGEAEEITVEVVHADVSPKAEFNCDNDLLNRLFDACRRSLLGNMHCGVISDCPHRERIGYTGDGQNTADVSMLMLDADEFYRKFIRDIADTQDVKTGRIQNTAPFYGGGGGPGGWGCAIITIPYMHYKHYGDPLILKQYYPNMIKYIEFMKDRCKNNLVSANEDEHWIMGLGEWGTEVIPPKIPHEYVNTYFLVKSLMYMSEIADVIGEPSDDFVKSIDVYKDALRKNFYDESENTYCSGINGADAFAADIGLADDECIKNLNKKYENNRFDTGIFGTALLVDVLFKNGYEDTAMKLLTEEGPNTFYEHHIDFGATTLWENWRGGSHNHHMFGAVVSNFFYNMLGIKLEKNIGNDIVIEPKIPRKINYAYASVKTRIGTISVTCKKDGGETVFEVYLPQKGSFVYNGMSYEIAGGRQNVLKFNNK